MTPLLFEDDGGVTTGYELLRPSATLVACPAPNDQVRMLRTAAVAIQRGLDVRFEVLSDDLGSTPYRVRECLRARSRTERTRR